MLIKWSTLRKEDNEEHEPWSHWLQKRGGEEKRYDGEL